MASPRSARLGHFRLGAGRLGWETIDVSGGSGDIEGRVNITASSTFSVDARYSAVGRINVGASSVVSIRGQHSAIGRVNISVASDVSVLGIHTPPSTSQQQYWSQGLVFSVAPGSLTNKFWRDGEVFLSEPSTVTTNHIGAVLIASSSTVSVLASKTWSGRIAIGSSSVVSARGNYSANGLVRITSQASLLVNADMIQTGYVDVQTSSNVSIVYVAFQTGTVSIDCTGTFSASAMEFNISAILTSDGVMYANPAMSMEAETNLTGQSMSEFVARILSQAGPVYLYGASDPYENSISAGTGSGTLSGIVNRWDDQEFSAFRLSNGFMLDGDISVLATGGIRSELDVFTRRTLFKSYEEIYAPPTTPPFTIDSIVTREYDHDLGVLAQNTLISDTDVSARLTNTQIEMLLQSSDIGTRFSHTNIEMLISPGANTRLSNCSLEFLKLANFAAMKQMAVESLMRPDSNIRINSNYIEVLVESPKKMRLSNTQLDILKGSEDNPPVRLSTMSAEILRERTEASLAQVILEQHYVEVPYTVSAGTPANVKQMAIEAMVIPDSNGRVKQMAIENLNAGNPGNVRLKQDAVEMLGDGTPNARAKQMTVEILVKVQNDPTVGGLANNPKMI